MMIIVIVGIEAMRPQVSVAYNDKKKKTTATTPTEKAVNPRTNSNVVNTAKRMCVGYYVCKTKSGKQKTSVKAESEAGAKLATC